MKKGFKKAIASMLAVTMVLGSSIMSFADDATPAEGVSNNTTLTASGNFEGHVNKSVVNVQLPTVSADDYNFIIDPELLINATNHEKYPDATFTGTTGVYFPTSVEDGKVNYTDTSVAGQVTNKSSVSVNVTMSIKLTDLNDSITMVSENAVNTGTGANLWLAVTNGSRKVAVEDTTAKLTENILGADGNYIVSYNKASDTYQYVIDPAASNSWGTATLSLTGKCNTNGDWSASGLSEESKIEVTWSYEDASAAADCYVFFDGDGWWIGKSVEEGFGDDVSSAVVTVNGKSVPCTVSGGWVGVTWAAYDAAGGDATAAEFKFTVEAGGKRYADTFTW